MECGKTAAYLGSRHLGKHSNTGPHPTEHRNRKKTEGSWSRSKYPPKPSNPVPKHIPPAREQVLTTAQETQVTQALSWTRPAGSFASSKRQSLHSYTHPNQKGFANRPPDLAFLVALELQRLLGEVSPAPLFCFLCWKLCGRS